jgi:group I intron endonuclease
MKAIYQITNNNNGKFYIGSAQNLQRRWDKHRSELNNGKHANRYLQNAWDKNGGENFSFVVLEEVAEDEDLLVAEQRWLDGSQAYNRAFGYNILTTAGSSLGHSHSAKTKRKMREAWEARKESQEWKERRRQQAIAQSGAGNASSKLTWEKVRQMRALHEQDGIGPTRLAGMFGISPNTARNIVKRKSWKNDPNERH